MSDNSQDSKQSTTPRPYGGEFYTEVTDSQGHVITLTYNDLWMHIVCLQSLDGDWQRARQAAGMVPDAARKRAIIDRLWRLEQVLNGLPAIPEGLMQLNLHRAHVWFNTRQVSDRQNTLYQE
ncbi:MAG: hypothetical protein GYB67_15515 [Chloroflexi bacterium]|nr:hypothetical protein [Chloroflexota bacterium]